MKHTGPAPFGFTWDGNSLRVVEEEARIRRLAFELYAESQSKRAVAKQLNAAGHRTRRGSAWRDVTIARLLTCSSARGLYARNRTATNDGGERIEKPDSEQEFVECPPLVPRDLWDKVQAALANDAPPIPAPSLSSHAFTGVLFCQCGARMNVASSAPKFSCRQCGDRIPIRDLEERFLDEVTSYLRARREVAAEFLTGDPAIAEQRSALREAEQKAQRLDAEISKVERLMMEDRIAVPRFEKLHRPLEEERRGCQRELGKIKAKLSRLEAKAESDPPQPAFDPDELRKRWSTIPIKAQRDIVRAFLNRIVVAQDEIEFTCRFREASSRTVQAQQVRGATSSRSRSAAEADGPLFIRLPPPGQRCPRTGMTRSALNDLILPTERNGYRPPVASKSLRKHEGGKGTRLIFWQSLKDFLGGEGGGG